MSENQSEGREEPLEEIVDASMFLTETEMTGYLGGEAEILAFNANRALKLLAAEIEKSGSTAVGTVMIRISVSQVVRKP